MNTIFKFTRIVFVLALLLSALGISTSFVQAGGPTKGVEYWEGDEDPGLCLFPINEHYVANATSKDFLDKDGVWVKTIFHIVETNTFTGQNGKTLVSLPYTWNVISTVDGDYAVGIGYLVRLPDGGMFVQAGRNNFITGVIEGNPGNNIAAFCAALQ